METGLLHKEDPEKRFKERLASPPGIVDELEEGEVQRKQFLRDAPVWPQPGAQQRPEPLDGVDMDFMEPIPIVISGVLADRVADGLMAVSPRGESGVDIVLVRVDQTAWLDHRSDERFDGYLLDVFEHANEHLA